MKRLAIAVLSALVASATNLAQVDIFNEETQQNIDVCANPHTRWSHSSNRWNLYKAFLNQNKKKFKDPGFQTNMYSIYGPAATSPQRQAQYQRAVKGWRRPGTIYKQPPSLLGKFGSMRPTGIKQGGLADCWFLAGAAATAEVPSRLNMNVHKNSRGKYNGQGIFRYYFYVQGKAVRINIDDFLPVRYKYSNSKDYFVPAMADRSNFGAWWMPLLEKAYAKFQGNYDRLEWGSGFESLRQFTNAPVFRYNHVKMGMSQDQVYNLFKTMGRKKYPMVVSCCVVEGNNPTNSRKDTSAPDGLQNAHAYSLLDVITLQGTALVKIRNPWSVEGYKGAWSDKDSRWTPALLKQANHKLANDGIFFMPLAQFLKPPYFRSTTAAIYHKWTQKPKTYQVRQTVKQLQIAINVPVAQHVYFVLEGLNPRMYKGCKKDNTFMNTFFYKGSRFPGMKGLTFPRGYMGQSLYHLSVGQPGYSLPAGRHTLLVANWNHGKGKNIQEYSLTVYQEGSGRVTVKY